jgi:hypothetical protein
MDSAIEAKDEDVDPEIFKVYKRKAYDFADYKDKGLKLKDTTGAGDSFTGAYAVAMLEGLTHKEALKFACKVAFLTVSKMGAGPSMPTRQEIAEVFEKKEDAPICPVNPTDHEDVLPGADMVPQDLEGHHYMALIRHGERADRCPVER